MGFLLLLLLIFLLYFCHVAVSLLIFMDIVYVIHCTELLDVLIKRFLIYLILFLPTPYYPLLFKLGAAECLVYIIHFFWEKLLKRHSLKQRNRAPVDNFMDHSQVIKNGTGHENSVAVTPTTLVNAQNPVESDFGTAAAYNVMDNTHGPATQAVPLSMPLQNMFTTVGRSDMPTQSLHGSVSDVENIASQPLSHFSQGRLCPTECAVPSNTINEQEELTIESGTISISSAYSQGLVFAMAILLQ